MATGSRAEYGLLRKLLKTIAASDALTLQLIVTGMHLAPEFGGTWTEIEEDGLRIDRRIDMQLTSDTANGAIKSMAIGMAGVADALTELRPDIVLLVGDRFEIMAVATAALMLGVPIAHVHGGEATEGAVDDAIRHAVTKMASLHFVAAEPYRRRVIQMGEHPDRVFLVGGLGVDAFRDIALLSRADLEREMGFKFGAKNLIVTFHPVTREPNQSAAQFRELLSALAAVPDTHLVLTLPNADPEGRALIPLIEQFVADRPNARAFPSLGQRRYLSCLAYVDGMVGNSSSGLLEMPSFRKGTVNIGTRQKGRLSAASVIDCEPDKDSILAAIAKLYSPEFIQSLEAVKNPYGEGGASERIAMTLETIPLDGLSRKRFFDQ